MEENKYTLDMLYQYVSEVFQLSPIPDDIRRQISTYVIRDNMSYREIARCLCYYLEVERQTVKRLYGMSFVPKVRNDAAKYFEKLERDQKSQEEEAQKIMNHDINIKFKIETIKNKPRKIKQLDINEINIEGEEDGN